MLSSDLQKNIPSDQKSTLIMKFFFGNIDFFQTYFPGNDFITGELYEKKLKTHSPNLRTVQKKKKKKK